MEIARLRTVWTGWTGAPGVTTMYYRKRTTSAWTAIPNQLIAQVQNAFAEVLPILNESVLVTTEGAIDIIEDTTGELLQTINGTQDQAYGSTSSNLAPPATAIQVRYHTNSVYRGHRVVGSTFLAPLAINASDDEGTPTVTALGLAEAFGETAAISSSYGQLVVWSRPTSKTASDGRALDVESVTVNDKFAVLRSRRD